MDSPTAIENICSSPQNVNHNLKAPFPWFGGKSRVAPIVWERLGNVPHYVEPFFGSGAMVLGRPHAPGNETVNDKDAFIANFWRATANDPEEVAFFADWPINENDLHARHAYLVKAKEDLVARIEGDPFFYDARIAGWWVWGICVWIGAGWCSGKGPWRIVNGKLVKTDKTSGTAIRRQLPNISGQNGIHRKIAEILGSNRGISSHQIKTLSWIIDLSNRMRRVRICCGDWSRIMGPSASYYRGLTGIFLDPPYGGDIGRHNSIYMEEDLSVSKQVNEYCIENGANKLLRIALCGYDGEHNNLEALGWDVHRWKAVGGYGNQGNGAGSTNPMRERIWFSPHCLSAQQGSLF